MGISAWARLRSWAAPPRFAEDDRNRVAGLLHYFLLAIILGASLSAITTLTGSVATERAVFPVVIVLVSLASFVLVRLGRVRLAGLLVTGGLWVITTISAGTGGGLGQPSFSFYVLTIILAAVLLDERASLVFTGLSILSGLVMAYLTDQGQFQQVIVSPPDTAAGYLTFYATLFLTAGAVLFATSRSIRSTVARLRSSEQSLAERNRELEGEIAARTQAEAERNNLFELSLDLLAVLDADGTFKRLNPAFEAMLGYPEPEVLGKSLNDFVHPNDRALLRGALERLAEGLPITDFECRCVSKDGGARLLSWNARPVEGVLYAVARDVTDRVEARQSQTQLAVAIEKANFLTEFLATVSHDIKNPLTVINASLYLLERVEDPARQRVQLGEIKQQTRIVDRLIQDILTVSRLDYQASPKRESVDLSYLLSEIVRRLAPRAAYKNIQVQLDTTPALPPISADYDQLERAFTNLIENGLTYTPDGGRVEVHMLADAGQLVVEVRDTGIGIQERDLPHVFERFYRSDEARSFEKGGSGLGLAIVKKVLDMHQARIQISSMPGKGTTFHVELPVTLPAPAPL